NSDPKFENVYLFKDYTTADGDPDDDPNYIYVYDASNYAVDDVIEITNDGVARTVIELDTTHDIVYFNPELDEFSRGFISVYNWDDGSDVDEDYRLQTTSMAIDAGNPDSDYSNEPNDGGGRVNMGAYGNTDEASLSSVSITDTDGDGMDDDWEDTYNLDDTDSYDGYLDYDHDGLINLYEYLLGTNPNVADTDGDGMLDGWEYDNQLDPTNGEGADGADGDVDNDGISNYNEYLYNLSVYRDDSTSSWSATTYDTDSSEITATATYAVIDGTVTAVSGTTNSYDNLGRAFMTRQTDYSDGDPDENDRIILTVYDAQGNVLQSVVKGVESTDPNVIDTTDDIVTQNVYDDLGRVLYTRDAENYWVRNVYDAYGRLESVKRAPTASSSRPSDGSFTVTDSTKVFGDGGRVDKVINALTDYVTYEYDSMGHVIDTVAYEEDGATDIALLHTIKEYDGLGHVTLTALLEDPDDTSYSTSDDKITAMIYDPNIDPDSGLLSERWEYVGGAGSYEITDYSYDLLGRLVMTEDPEGNEVTTGLDTMGRTTHTLINEDGGDEKYTAYEYDDLGRVSSKKYYWDPDEEVYLTDSYTYDSEGRRAAAINAKWSRNTFVYNSDGQKTSETLDADNIGTQITYAYDRLQRRTSITAQDVDGSTDQVTTYEYDKLNRLTKTTYPDSETLEYEYNYRGKVSRRTDQREIVIDYTYDVAGNLTTKEIEDEDVDAVYDYTESFTYDGLGRMITADKYDEDEDEYIGESDFSYNGFGLIEQTAEEILDSNDVRYINYEYDQRGDLSGFCYPDGSSAAASDITYTRDDAGRITHIRKSGSTVAEYNYNGYQTSWLKYRVPGDGDGVITYYTYNGLGWLTDIRSTLNNDGVRPTVLVDFDYTRDNTANITQQVFGHRDSTPDNDYTYDTMDRLTKVDYLDSLSEEFDYDKLGNRESIVDKDDETITYAIDYETNRYDESGSYGVELEYDEAGNTTVNYDRYQFFYDYENRLIEVQTDANDVVVEYTYNALGRRSQKHEVMGIDDDYIRYYYNKDYQVLSETDEDDAELRTFIYGRGLDEVLVMT
ncbi:MAG: RHS repeat protein, partial [Planctomycetes bacterium]|nr:RHS repeat protein [Planctomycetota bacterium]